MNIELNKIYCWDYLEVIKQIPDKSIDLVLTDPPYLHVKWWMKSLWLNKWCRANNSNTVINMSDFWEKEIFKFLNIIDKKLKIMNSYIFCSKLQIPYYLNWAVEKKYNFDILIRDKDFTWIISRKFFANNSEYIIRIYKKWLNRFEDNIIYQKIQKFKRPINKLHESEKPIKLLENYIKLSSNEWDIILDPFAWSWTTWIACKNTNRNYILIEKEQKYVDIANNRLKNTIVSLFV